MTICSLVLQVTPNIVDSTISDLEAMDSVEVHAQDDLGKIVITIDHASRDYCSKTMSDITHFKGMMSTALIYEYQDDLVDELIQKRTAQPQGNSL
ncbi:MAG: chaperone NapD [Thiotrichaceae bacterium]|nr:chaperone NapD [Thiotrichaceae bacterium]